MNALLQSRLKGGDVKTTQVKQSSSSKNSQPVPVTSQYEKKMTIGIKGISNAKHSPKVESPVSAPHKAKVISIKRGNTDIRKKVISPKVEKKEVKREISPKKDSKEIKDTKEEKVEVRISKSVPKNYINKVPIVIIYEDEKRTNDLVSVFQSKSIRYELVNLKNLDFSLFSLPKTNKVYYNRVSGSSFYRGNQGCPAIGRIILKWLQQYKCVVANGAKSVELEISKADQIMALNAYKIKTPKTFVCMNKEGVMRSLDSFDKDDMIVVKPNQGGSGNSVFAFSNPELAKKLLESKTLKSADNLFIVQTYVLSNQDQSTPPSSAGPSPVREEEDKEKPKSYSKNVSFDAKLKEKTVQTKVVKKASSPRMRNEIRGGSNSIVAIQFGEGSPASKKAAKSNIAGQSKGVFKDYAYRLEIVGGRVIYVLKIDSSYGFQLCPCDAKKEDTRFDLILHPETELAVDMNVWNIFVDNCLQMCKAYEIDVCAIEFKLDNRNLPRVYDVNVNTNYNAFIEESAKNKYEGEKIPRGLDSLADYLVSLAVEVEVENGVSSLVL